MSCGFLKAAVTTAALCLSILLLAGCGADNTRSASELAADTDDNSLIEPTVSDDASATVSSDGTENTEPAISRAECEQIVTLFKDWGDLDYNIHPDQTNTDRADCFPDCVDKSHFITEAITLKGSTRTYEEYFYKIVSGDYSTEEGFAKKIGDMFTENFKEKYLASSSAQMFRFQNGETYTAGFSRYNETEPEIGLKVIIKSIGESTVEISVSSAADNENAEQEYSAKLVKSENGNYKIDEVGKDDGSMFELPRLFHCKNAEVTILWADKALFTL